ncbi:MAG: hypothetical protein ABI595_01660 [Actinomycetota bacterium]
MILRRKRSSPQVQASFVAFRDVLEHLEPAKAALTEVMPTTRMPGRPLPDALAEFEEGLRRAEGSMPGWRSAALEPEWSACERGLAEARDRARRFREDAPELVGFEGLIWAVEELMAPLDGFATAAERFRKLGAR